MAKPKTKVAICTVMAACDGSNLHPGRTICSRCEKKLAQKTKTQGKGENHVVA